MRVKLKDGVDAHKIKDILTDEQIDYVAHQSMAGADDICNAWWEWANQIAGQCKDKGMTEKQIAVTVSSCCMSALQYVVLGVCDFVGTCGSVSSRNLYESMIAQCNTMLAEGDFIFSDEQPEGKGECTSH